MPQNHSPAMTKRTKKHHSCDDPLSQLPDDILIIIVSFLTVKEAGRTSVLSSRWTKLWKHTPCLNFEDQNGLERIRRDCRQRRKGLRNYVEWVDRVLKLSKAPSLKQFSVHFDFDYSHRKAIEKWLRYAFSHHVEKLELNLKSLSFGNNMEWFDIFTNELLCNNSVNKVQPSFDFKPLKILCLKGMNVSGKDLEIFLYNCLNLEHMVVWNSSKLYDLEISGPSLKFLELHYCEYLRSLKVCNTNLAFLSLSRSFYYHLTLLLENVPSYVDVSLVLSKHCISVGEVPSLLSGCLLQLVVLEVLIKDPENITACLEFPELTKLKKLVLVVYRTHKFKYLIKLVPLLKATPCLKEFVLEYKLYGAPFRRPAKSARSKNGKMLKMLDRYSLPFLKVVKISGFPGQNSDFDFIRYFLENAAALGKIVVDPLKPKCPLPELEEVERQQRMRNLAKEFEEELPQHIDWVFLD